VTENAWISKATDTDTEGVTIKYPNGNTFQGHYDDEKVKQGKGKYIWSKAEGAPALNIHLQLHCADFAIIAQRMRMMRPDLKSPITTMANTKTARELVLVR
jgi:hypothetical protein